ncbi:MAG: MopE-related protein, partial [Polyangiaceae bacterium]
MRWLALTFVALLVVVLSCGSNPPARLIASDDAGVEASADSAPDGPARDADVGEASPYLGDPCVDDAQCDDHLACTYDSCDHDAGRCLNVPDDTQCQDGVYCDGRELCVPGHGCEPGAVTSCDNGNGCQIATCVEASQSCAYADRDVDGDGDPDAHCKPGHDCDDLNPDVSSIHAEVCSNGVDDNCN